MNWGAPGGFGVLLWAAAILASLCALGALAQWRRWKRRAQELRPFKQALHTLAFEAANAVNAIRSNLLAFRQANPSPAMPEHLEEIQRGTERIEAALKKIKER